MKIVMHKRYFLGFSQRLDKPAHRLVYHPTEEFSLKNLYFMFLQVARVRSFGSDWQAEEPRSQAFVRVPEANPHVVKGGPSVFAG